MIKTKKVKTNEIIETKNAAGQPLLYIITNTKTATDMGNLGTCQSIFHLIPLNF